MLTKKNIFQKILILSIFIIIPFSFSLAKDSNNLNGLILLQVEDKGKAWYVSPSENKRVYLNRPWDAFSIMRNYGLGIKAGELDYYLKNSFPDRLMGKILLDVERNGEAYYIYPKDQQAYFLNRPSDAFSIMRSLSLGITNKDLERIDILETKDDDNKNKNDNEEENNKTENKDEKESSDNIVENEKEDLPDEINSLDKFIDNIEGSSDLVEHLNKYFSLKERDGFETKTPKEFFADKGGNHFDFLVFSRHVLSEKLQIVFLIRYEYLENNKTESRAVVVFRDEDNEPRHISFSGDTIERMEYGNSSRALIRFEEDRLNIEISRWAYFPLNNYDLSEVKYPYSWQN